MSFALIAALAILLFPSVIAPEPFALRESARPAVAATPTVTPAKTPSREAMGLKKVAPFDRERFLLSFERQTSGALIKCLKEQIGEKGAVDWIARLHSNGQLTAVRSTNALAARVSCAVPMIEAMRFPTDLSPDLNKNAGGVEIEWRLDW